MNVIGNAIMGFLTMIAPYYIIIGAAIITGFFILGFPLLKLVYQEEIVGNGVKQR